MRRLLIRSVLPIGIALAALLFLAGIFLTCNPQLIIGPYVRGTITSVTIDGQGQASVSWDSSCPPGTWVTFRTITDAVGEDHGGGGGGGGGGLLTFANRVTMTFNCDLVGPEDRVAHGPVPDQAALA